MLTFDDIFNGVVERQFRTLKVFKYSDYYSVEDSCVIESSLKNIPRVEVNKIYFNASYKECSEKDSTLFLSNDAYSVALLLSFRYPPSEILTFLDITNKEFKVHLSYLINNFEDLMEILLS